MFWPRGMPQQYGEKVRGKGAVGELRNVATSSARWISAGMDRVMRPFPYWTGSWIDALLAKLPTVRVIHGKGTGVLRKAVQTRLL